MEKFEISSNLFPCVLVDTYESELSIYNFEVSSSSDPFAYACADYDEYLRCIENAANDWIQWTILPMMKKYGVEKIVTDGIHQPSYYNYETDRLDFTVKMSDGWRETMHRWLDEFGKSGDDKYGKFINAHYRSRSGFISLMPESFEEIEKMEDEERCVGAYLTMCLLNEFSDEQDLAEFVWDGYNVLIDDVRANLEVEEKNGLVEMFGERAEELLRVYASDYEMDSLYWDVVQKVGFPWLRDEECQSFFADGEWFQAENDAQKFLIWAAKNEYCVAALQEMAA